MKAFLGNNLRFLLRIVVLTIQSQSVVLNKVCRNDNLQTVDGCKCTGVVLTILNGLKGLIGPVSAQCIEVQWLES